MSQQVNQLCQECVSFELNTSESKISRQSFVKQLVHWTVTCSPANVSPFIQTGMQNGTRGVTVGFLSSSWDGDLEGGSRDVVLAPFDHQDVAAPLLQQVADVVLQVAHVFDQNLLTGNLRTVYTHQEHVLTGFAAVDGEAALLAHKGLAEARTSTQHLAGIRVGRPGHSTLGEAAAGRPQYWIHCQGRRLAGVGYIHQSSTCDFGLEGAAGDVVRASIFDADQVVPGRHGSVLHLVALWNLLAIHLYLGRTLNGHGQGPRARLSVVDDEL